MFNELAHLLGATGLVVDRARGTSYEVSVKDVRKVYNRAQVQVEPTRGGGTAWVDLESFTGVVLDKPNGRV